MTPKKNSKHMIKVATACVGGGSDLVIRSDDSRRVAVVRRLLRLIWDFPEAGGSQASWAVKESLILRGQLQQAKEQPGLGIAMYSVELGLRAFGKCARNRVRNCMKWGLEHTDQHDKLLRADVTDSRTGRVESRPDFRHTLALAVVLAIVNTHREHLNFYLRLVLQRQQPDGGWPSGEGVTVSEVFTVFYAIEFLTRCAQISGLPASLRRRALDSRDRAVLWLIQAADLDHLWASGIFKDLWDPLFTTAWVLRRLLPLKGLHGGAWMTVAHAALEAMVHEASASATWKNTPPMQRFRVMARIGSAVAIARREFRIRGMSAERATNFLRDWRAESIAMLETMPESELDLSTALFLLDALATTTQQRAIGRSLVRLPNREGASSETISLPATASNETAWNASKAAKPINNRFAVFLSHNSKDKTIVRQLGEALKARGLRVWLDEWELVPGRPWQEELENIIRNTKSAAVLVGADGLGPWEIPEMRGCLSEFVDRQLPIIPVLLPGASKQPGLPLFLKQFTWVDLRGGLTKGGLDRLVWGITGKKP